MFGIEKVGTYIKFKKGELMKQSQFCAEEKPKSKIPKYSDRFKDLLSKLQTHEKKQQPKEQLKFQPHYEPQQIIPTIDKEYVFVSQLQKQFFFFRVKSIGVGAHSFVYLIQEQQTKCLYAQKAITKSHAQKHMKQLVNQIKIQYMLSHDNLISLYHFYTDLSYVYLIMEYAQESLFGLKTKFKIFKEKQVIQILRQLLHGISYMHKQGFIHADIKIQNIMIRNGRIKLCDFGYASKFTTQKNIDANEIIGTLEYLSPEYVQGLDTGPLRDIWAIGILCFELWTGKNPFQELKENEKWMKLVKPDYGQFLEQLRKIQKNEERKSQKIEQIIRHTLCPYQQRYTAEQILKMDFFVPAN